MKNWYAVHCKPRQDQRAEENLQNQGYEVLRPRARVRRRGRGKMVNVLESFFPRYLFIRLDDVAQNWAPIRSTRGVANLVKFSDEPTPVHASVIDGLQSCLDDEQCIDLTADRYARNDTVRIVEGPFRGFEGRLFSLKGEERAIVLVNVMQRLQRLTLPEYVIEPA